MMLQEHSAARSVIRAFCHGNADGQSMLAATLVPPADQSPGHKPHTPRLRRCRCCETDCNEFATKQLSPLAVGERPI